MVSGRVVLLSTGVLSTGVALRVAVPAATAFLRAEVPRMYGAALAWLTPPYLYFVINVIIISIAASSRFHNVAEGEERAAAPKEDAAVIRAEDDLRHPAPVSFEEVGRREGEGRAALRPPPAEEYGGGKGIGAAEESVAGDKEMPATRSEEGGGGGGEDEEFVISRSAWTPRRRETSEVLPASPEKPLVSVRFAARRSVKASPEGRTLGVARPKKNETLENTWKTITDGRAMPLTRHLKKSDTWTAGGGRVRADAAAAAEKTPVRKSETFKERRAAADSSPSPSSGGSSRSRRDASMGQDDLNRRVEAFIRKFNEEMRLQRQESFKHYTAMMNRGGH